MKVIYRILLTAGIIAALFSCAPEKEQQEQEQQQQQEQQPEPDPDPNPDPDPDPNPDPDPEPVPEDGSAAYPFRFSSAVGLFPIIAPTFSHFSISAQSPHVSAPFFIAH